MNHLLRGHAPLSDSNWKLLDAEARERLRGPLAARRLVDFSGPHGWEHSATNLGRAEKVAAPNGKGVSALRRRVLPLLELRADFAISRAELRDDDRGAVDVDLAPLDEAARRIGSRRTSPSSTAGRKPGSAASRRPRRSKPANSAPAPRTTRARSPAPSTRSARAGWRGRSASPSAPTSTRG